MTVSSKSWIVALQVVFSFILFAETPARSFSFPLPLRGPLPLEIVNLLPKSLDRFSRNAVYFQNDYFVLVQNRSSDFCIGRKCLTFLTTKCGHDSCQYTVALTGTIFALGDGFVKTEIGGKFIRPLHAYCERDGLPDGLSRLSDTFQLGEDLAFVSFGASHSCLEKKP